MQVSDPLDPRAVLGAVKAVLNKGRAFECVKTNASQPV
jgi:hypothetical protein